MKAVPPRRLEVAATVLATTLCGVLTPDAMDAWTHGNRLVTLAWATGILGCAIAISGTIHRVIRRVRS